MPTSEFKQFLDDLPRQWRNTDAWEHRSEYMASVRASSLTADQIGQLRDSIMTGQPGTPAGQRLDTLRSMLQGLYESRLRSEQQRAESRLLRFVRNHPVGALLAFLGAAVITAFIALLVGIVFGDPITKWWQETRAQPSNQTSPSHESPTSLP